MCVLIRRCRAYISAILTAALLCAGFGIGVMHPAAAEPAAMPCHEMSAPVKAPTPDSCFDQCVSASIADAGIALLSLPAPRVFVVVDIYSPARVAFPARPRTFATRPPQRPPLQITQRLLI